MSVTPASRISSLGSPAAALLSALSILTAATFVQAQEADQTDEMTRARVRMVQEHIYDPPPPYTAVGDERVLRAMRAVPRHQFVPARLRSMAYANRPLPIGHGQTISQPYIVARMTELLELEPGERVLEVGTGSGYQAAVLAEITDSVYSIEIIGDLARAARQRLQRLGYDVVVRHGDGYRGWPEHAPFDAIIVTAAPEEIPPPLLEQLARSGRMVIPRGPEGGSQVLLLVRKTPDGEVEREAVSVVRFVPLLRDTAEGGSREDVEKGGARPRGVR